MDPSAIKFAFLSMADRLIDAPYSLSVDYAGKAPRMSAASSKIKQYIDFRGKKLTIAKDAFGAPYAMGDAPSGSGRILISITDEGPIRATLLVDPGSRNDKHLLGVGIDLINISDFEDVACWPEEALRPIFSAQEIAEIRSHPQPTRPQEAARIFSVKESLFKACSPLYRAMAKEEALRSARYPLYGHSSTLAHGTLRKGRICGPLSAKIEEISCTQIADSRLIGPQHIAALAICQGG